MGTNDWINLGTSVVAILVALLGATWFATRQNRKILVQNLEMETYKETWKAIEKINNALVNFSATVNLQLDFLENKINSAPNFQESQPDFDYRRRTSINNYSKDYDRKVASITLAGQEFHHLWEQKEPLMSGLNIAFRTYQNEFDSLRDQVQFPSKTRLHLDLINFQEMKPILEQENEKTIEACMRQLVYGMDLARLIQEDLIADYFNYKPIPRASRAEHGYELTREGLRLVKR